MTGIGNGVYVATENALMHEAEKGDKSAQVTLENTSIITLSVGRSHCVFLQGLWTSLRCCLD